ncbi:hypothetical protein PSPO01_14605 [Paraphaeosphaeria sporulosa]
MRTLMPRRITWQVMSILPIQSSRSTTQSSTTRLSTTRLRSSIHTKASSQPHAEGPRRSQ